MTRIAHEAHVLHGVAWTFRIELLELVLDLTDAQLILLSAHLLEMLD